MAETPQKLQRPKELYIDEKWDKCIDLMVKRTVYGTLAGGAAALLLLRGAGPRASLTALGAGFGLGSAWEDCHREFGDSIPPVAHEQQH